MLLHGQGEIVTTVLPYMERHDGVWGGSSRVSVKEAVEKGRPVDEASALRFADPLEGNRRHSGAHGVEVWQVAQRDLQGSNACTRVCT